VKSEALLLKGVIMVKGHELQLVLATADEAPVVLQVQHSVAL
jgi:hypothetical protein